MITLEEGDGKRWTEEEIRAAVAGGNSSSSSNKSSEPTAEQKKQEAEYAKKAAEVNAKNEDIKNKNTVIQKSLDEGNAAFKAKDYNTAIAKYTEGVNADPEYVGSAPILLNNRAVVLRLRATDTYNSSVKAADPQKSEGLAKTKQDLEDSLDSYKKYWTILKNAPANEIPNAANHERSKYDALSGMTEVYRLLVITKSDLAKGAEAKEAFDAYFAIETDAAKKAKTQLAYADMMRETGNSEEAIAGYRLVLQNTPDNMDALAGLGLSLFNQGVIANDKAQLQEGLNYMQKFAETAPDTHPLMANVKDAVDYLKSQEKLTPQKVTAPKKKP